jgi:hypothetical protein
MIRCAYLDVAAQTQVAPVHDLPTGGHDLRDARLLRHLMTEPTVTETT